VDAYGLATFKAVVLCFCFLSFPSHILMYLLIACSFVFSVFSVEDDITRLDINTIFFFFELEVVIIFCLTS